VHSISRTQLIAALIGVLVVCVAALLARSEPTRRAATHGLAVRSLDELSLLAGLATDEGELLREEPMAVEVVSEGGPLWVLDSVERAVAASPYFRVGPSPHLLRAEVIDERGGVALQLHLWRGGWELREPSPRRVRVAPWAALLAGVIGAGAALLTRRLSVGFAAGGVLAQVFLALDPLPADLFPPRPLLATWSEGPLFARVIEMIRELHGLALAVVAAVLAGSIVLVLFDHRRSRGSEEDLGLGPATLAALLGSVGALAWVEAASRGSLFAACDLRFGAYFGILGLTGLIVAWQPAIRVAREAWRARS
jgi:hypothetical protein